MSEQVHALMERLKSDASFREQIMAQPDPEARLASVQAAGFDCSLEDIAGLGGALAEADLEQVSGGLWDVCALNTCGAHCTAHGGW